MIVSASSSLHELRGDDRGVHCAAETSTDLYYWDFTSLCRNTGWYYFEKGNPDWGNFYFNICGTSPQLCVSPALGRVATNTPLRLT